DNLLREASDRATAYLHGLDGRSVFPSTSTVSQLKQLDGELPENLMDEEEVLVLLDEIGSPATVASAGGHYFGFVVGGSLPGALAANWLASAWDQNAMSSVSSPVAAKIEEIVIPWLLELLHLPEDCAGALVTGAMMANFTALAAARHAVLKKHGWDVEADGLAGSPPITVVVSEQAHPTLLKAASLLGLGHKRLVRVPVDKQGRLQAASLPTLSEQTILCIQSGNVNTGAFGLWAAATPKRQYLTAGIAEADSWATDAHKWLNVPYDSGIAFVRDREALVGDRVSGRHSGLN
ncbi:MAG: pyridoxal phosphate-dependent decarboxylase family protein, partial [Acidimicrobiales bacterium]